MVGTHAQPNQSRVAIERPSQLYSCSAVWQHLMNCFFDPMAEDGDPPRSETSTSAAAVHPSESLREIILQEVASALRSAEPGSSSIPTPASHSGKSLGPTTADELGQALISW